MNTYDFDKTIYINDSSADFILYCIGKFPGAMLRVLPKIAAMWVKYKLGRCEFAPVKETVFSYLKYVPNVDDTVRQFWDLKWKGIGKWYLDRRESDDIIISASPEFIVCPAGERLGVEVIATKMDKTTGKLLGKNCHDEEKVRRFLEAHPDGHTENFYSDSDNDLPMARFADRAFKIRRGKVYPWKVKKRTYTNPQ